MSDWLEGTIKAAGGGFAMPGTVAVVDGVVSTSNMAQLMEAQGYAEFQDAIEMLKDDINTRICAGVIIVGKGDYMLDVAEKIQELSDKDKTETELTQLKVWKKFVNGVGSHIYNILAFKDRFGKILPENLLSQDNYAQVRIVTPATFKNLKYELKPRLPHQGSSKYPKLYFEVDGKRENLTPDVLGYFDTLVQPIIDKHHFPIKTRDLVNMILIECIAEAASES